MFEVLFPDFMPYPLKSSPPAQLIGINYYGYLIVITPLILFYFHILTTDVSIPKLYIVLHLLTQYR